MTEPSLGMHNAAPHNAALHNAAPTAKSIIFLGGSFDPPHNGHIAVCDWIINTYTFDRFLLIPCASHPFEKRLSSFAHRLNMLKLAFTSTSYDSRVHISDIEGRIPTDRKSYTIDTLGVLKTQFPYADMWLACGSDIAQQIDSWHQSDALLRQVQLLIYPTQRIRAEVVEGHRADTSDNSDISAISSTDIRARVKAGKCVKDIVPLAVADYINASSLYTDSKDSI